jgi:predicted dinucleotide-binding enzyme
MKTNKIAVLGSGVVGDALANGFLKHGYEVMRGSRDPSKLAEWKNKAGSKASTGTFELAAAYGEIVVLAVKGGAAEALVKGLPTESLSGKTVIDTSNPIADLPPTNGVLSFFTDLNGSLMERLQKIAPSANFVKSFSCVGNALMVNPQLPGGKPTMFICGNNDVAKDQVRVILTQFGWDINDLGKAEAARAIEPLCMLWCIPGFLHNDWNHAFKMLQA